MKKDAPPRKYPPPSSIPPQTQGHLRWVTDMLYANQEATRATVGALTKEAADKLYGAKAIRQHLLAGGAHALTIQGMIGQAAEPQLANIPITVGILADIPSGLGTTDSGEIFVATDVGHLFVWDGIAWAMLDGAGYGVFANSTPFPNTYWASIDHLLGGSVNVTKEDGSGTTSVSFPSYSGPGGMTLFVRI